MQAGVRQDELLLSPAEAAWQAVRTHMRTDLGARNFDNWVKPARLLGWDEEDGELRLALPTPFLATQCESHFGERLLLAFRALLPDVRALRFVDEPEGTRPVLLAVPEVAADPAPEPQRAAEPGFPAPVAAGTGLDARYDFDGYVVGKANEVAYNAARSLAEGGPLGFNPLFLHGGTGLGKTHLMHAMGLETLRRRPEARVVYMSAEKFMVEFVTAMRMKDTMSFKTRLRSADLLMIDDVQFIARKESTQEEFFHTMNEVISAGRPLVISADRSPQDLEGVESRILSRLSWGLVADLNPADFELRYNILAKKLEATPGLVPADVVTFIAKRISSNVRELEGALNRVIAYARLKGRTIDIDFVQETLADLLRANQRRVTIDEIQRTVAEHFRIRQSEMTSARRAREVARPRQVAMYLAKLLTQRSLPEIGRRFGGRDHTTVIHAVRQIEKLRQGDVELDGDVRLLIRQLEG
jgi:chromosomal replication initiator protein